MNKKQKRSYEAPEITVYEMQLENHFLSVSGGTGEDMELEGEFAREYSAWG